MSTELLHEALTHEIIGAFYEVYNAVPYEQHESVYAAAMAIALGERNLAVRREVSYPLSFRHVRIGEIRPDLIVNDQVVVELKATERIAPAHEKQLLSYLQVTRHRVGLLFNFGPKADRRRLVLTGAGPRLTER
jgi:GxxExxY protein